MSIITRPSTIQRKRDCCEVSTTIPFWQNYIFSDYSENRAEIFWHVLLLNLFRNHFRQKLSKYVFPLIVHGNGASSATQASLQDD